MVTSPRRLCSSPSEPDPGRTVLLIQGLVDRLSSPDLTASEAEDLRPRLLGLLARIEAEESAPPAPAPAPAPVEMLMHCGLECCAAV
jgi:hypothetical protein